MYYYVHRELKGSSSGIHNVYMLCSQINSVVIQADTKKNHHVQSVTTKHFKYIPKLTCTMYQVHSKTTGSCSSTCIYQKPPCSQQKRISSSVYQISPCSQRNNREQFKFKTTMMFAIPT